MTAGLDFRILHANVRSLVKNRENLELLINDMKSIPNIIGITETKLKDNYLHKPNITGYNFESVNSKTNAGGVGVYIENNMSYKIIDNLQLNISDCEDLWLEISINKNQKLIVGVIYRHPKSNLNLFKTKFENTIETINQTNLNYVICGDFNIDLLKTTAFVNDYLDTLMSSGCSQFIKSPTRFSPDNSSQSLLDHIYSNINSNNIKCNIIQNDISDHRPILTSINYSLKTTNKRIKYIRDMTKFNSSEFLVDLQNRMNTLFNNSSTNVNELVDKFLTTYNNVVNSNAPLRKLSKKQQKIKRQPYINSEILKFIKNKNKLLKLYIKNKTLEAEVNYKKSTK